MSPGRPREILEILLLNPLPRVLSSDRSPAACDETRGAWRVGTLPIPLNSCACACLCVCTPLASQTWTQYLNLCSVCPVPWMFGYHPRLCPLVITPCGGKR